jgi:Holliday junction resolvase RusA-like endonuclease
MRLTFTLDGEPFQKGTYVIRDGTVISKSTSVEEFFRKRMQGKRMLAGPIKMRVKFYVLAEFRCDKNCRKKGCASKHIGQHVSVRPDLSNYIKAIEDPMTGIVYQDDGRICEIIAGKYYSDNPRTEIELSDEFHPRDEELPE